jgi:hypothetical protein
VAALHYGTYCRYWLMPSRLDVRVCGCGMNAIIAIG